MIPTPYETTYLRSRVRGVGKVSLQFEHPAEWEHRPRLRPNRPNTFEDSHGGIPRSKKALLMLLHSWAVAWTVVLWATLKVLGP
ncbi:hypothetical protein ACOSQ3_030755 [Xanthoceras sorbifolium]